MKTIRIFTIAALIGGAFASEIQPQNNLQNQEFKGNWTHTFDTRVGPIIHTPTYVKFGGIQAGKGLHLNTSYINDFPLTAPLILNTDSTIEEFGNALVRSGLL